MGSRGACPMGPAMFLKSHVRGLVGGAWAILVQGVWAVAVGLLNISSALQGQLYQVTGAPQLPCAATPFLVEKARPRQRRGEAEDILRGSRPRLACEKAPSAMGSAGN
eukprot:7758070-Alexandrium_andersonii.AAC.1